MGFVCAWCSFLFDGMGFTRDFNGDDFLKKTTSYQIIGCYHRFTGHEEKYCSACNLKRSDNECLDGIAVGERAYIYLKVVR
jgi:hypothetical protein